MSYWNRPFFPEWCGNPVLDDYVAYDTMLRIAGSFFGISQMFKVVADHYGWTHIVLLSDEDITNTCWYGAKPFEEVFGNDVNYTFMWLRISKQPTDHELDDVLQKIRSHARGFFATFYCITL